MNMVYIILALAGVTAACMICAGVMGVQGGVVAGRMRSAKGSRNHAGDGSAERSLEYARKVIRAGIWLGAACLAVTLVLLALNHWMN